MARPLEAMRSPISITPDGVIEVSNYVRDLPADIVRRATFVIDIGLSEDKREAHEKTVPSCEGDKCSIPQHTNMHDIHADNQRSDTTTSEKGSDYVYT
jgi:hypothetical protein